MPFATPGAAPARPDDSTDPADGASGDGASGDGMADGQPVVLADPATVDRHHITRIDIEPSAAHPGRHPTHGWQVRARRAGTRVSKFFADSRYGSPEAALGASVAYRDRLLASLPEPTGLPRKAWSNTGVVGLSVREKDEGPRPKLYVQLNWVDAAGQRRASSYSVDKWGLRRALWNGCLRLYRERAAAGAPVEEPHVMFARAQEPFQDLLVAELAAERAREADAGPVEAPVRTSAPAEPSAPAADASARTDGETPDVRLEREEQEVRRLETLLFG